MQKLHTCKWSVKNNRLISRVTSKVKCTEQELILLRVSMDILHRCTVKNTWKMLHLLCHYTFAVSLFFFLSVLSRSFLAVFFVAFAPSAVSLCDLSLFYCFLSKVSISFFSLCSLYPSLKIKSLYPSLSLQSLSLQMTNFIVH